MRRFGSRSGLRLAVIVLAASVVLPAGWTALTGGEPPPAKPIEAAFPKLTAAKNPPTLQLQADDRTVHGWVSGAESFAGQGVKVTTGDIVQTVTVAADNTFSFPYDVERPLTAECSLGKLSGRLTISPRPEVHGPTAFFVVDRTAYRPGQTLQFAAFLRREDERGEFVPLTGEAVEVLLTSRQKDLVATRLSLRSDDMGRVVGSYTFTDADVLDEYELTIPNFVGSAKVLLAEYRKSKVRLKVSGTTAGTKTTLKFEALDFLDKPMAMEHGSFTAQVVRRSSSTSAGTLKVEEFVRHEPQPLPRLGFDDISEDDLLFHESESAGGLIFTRGRDVVAEFQQDLRRDGDRLADAGIDLKPEWVAGGFDLIVDGVVTDATGREQHATETIAISPTAEKGPKPVELVLPRTRFSTGDAIEVRAAGGLFEKQAVPAGTLMVMRLAYQLPSSPLFAKSEDNELPSGRLPGFGSRTPAPRVYESKVETIRQTPVTAVAIQEGRAKLTLAEPGAYRLIALVPKADGTTERAERTILVKRPDDVNPFELKLDKAEYAAGERLTGFVRSRYADAKALLTLRDSRGIAWAKPITFRDGVYRISEECPPGLRYGCTLDVLYPEDGTTTRLAHAATRVVPSGRLLDVKVTAPDQVAPGSTVKLDLQVNRKEPVDLIVSVYDRSLLAIQPDTNPNVRNFYHADDRAANRLDRELLRRRLGDVRLNTLIKKIEDMLKDPKFPQKDRVRFEHILAPRDGEYMLFPHDVVTLLRVAGIDVYYSIPASVGYWSWQLGDRNPRLVDVLQHISGRSSTLALRFVGNTLLIQENLPYTVPSGSLMQWHPFTAGTTATGSPGNTLSHLVKTGQPGVSVASAVLAGAASAVASPEASEAAALAAGPRTTSGTAVASPASAAGWASQSQRSSLPRRCPKRRRRKSAKTWRNCPTSRPAWPSGGTSPTPLTGTRPSAPTMRGTRRFP